MKETTFEELNSKVIYNAQQARKKGYNDDGYLVIRCGEITNYYGNMIFTNKMYLIISSFGGFTGGSEDEYPTNISIYEISLDELCDKYEMV